VGIRPEAEPRRVRGRRLCTAAIVERLAAWGRLGKDNRNGWHRCSIEETVLGDGQYAEEGMAIGTSEGSVADLQNGGLEAWSRIRKLWPEKASTGQRCTR
jgi:hypothetical protein